MTTQDAKRLSTICGMYKIKKIYKECLIGYCYNINGLCVITKQNGIRGSHIKSLDAAIMFIDKLNKPRVYEKPDLTTYFN